VNTDDQVITITTSPDSPLGVYNAPISGTSASCPGGYGNFCYAEFVVAKTKPLPKISCAPTSKVCSVPSGPQLWWFNGVSPNPENYRTILQVTPQGTKDTWTITAGSDYAQFSNNSSTIDLSGTNLVVILPKGDPGTNSPTVTVTVTVTRKDGTKSTSAPFSLAVRKPYELFPKAQKGHAADATNVVDKTHPSPDCLGCAYFSEIHYAIRDQTGAVLPFPVPLNEHFTSGLSCDYLIKGSCATNWPFSQNCGAKHFCEGDQAPSDWADGVGIGVGGTPLTPKPLPPGPLQKPPIPLGSVEVIHWSGTWGIGDGTPGEGVAVQTNTWQRWQDHARHTNVVSPP